MGQVAGSSEAEYHSNIENVVQSMEGLVIGSHFPTKQLPSQQPQESSPTLKTPSLSDHMQSSPMAFSQALSSSSACGFQPKLHAFRDHSPMPPLMRPSSASDHYLQRPYLPPASAAATASSTFPSQQYPASSRVSGSQRLDSANQTIQTPPGLGPRPGDYQSSRSSTLENDPAIDDGSSHLFPEIEGSSYAALIGLMGAMDHLVPYIRPPYEATKEATKFIAAECSLSGEERVILCIYYGKHVTEAAALSHMEGSLRRAVFRKVLEGPPSYRV